MLLVLAGCGILGPSSAFAFRITYQAVPVDGRSPTADEMDTIRTIVESRLSATGIAEMRVSVEPPDRLVVESSPASVLDEIRSLAGTTGRVDFVPLGQTATQGGQQLDLTEFPSLFPGTEVAGATIGSDQTGQRTVDLTLRSQGKALLARYTADHVGDNLAIVLDGTVVSAFVIMEPVLDGQLQISLAGNGGSQLAEAQNLVSVLEFGQLPFPLREIALEQH